MYNLRVYGIFIKGNGELLLCDEFRYGRFITKFPGGGLNPGEGLLDALRREWKEETGCTIGKQSHFYTTEFYQQSAFDPGEQLISVYYRVWHKKIPAEIKRTREELKSGKLSLRWKKPVRGWEKDFTFPVDRHVALMLAGS